MTRHADILHDAIVELTRRITKNREKATRIHGMRKCGINFWCGGYCDKVRELTMIRHNQSLELRGAMAHMAAEKLAVAHGLNDDVLCLIARLACE